MCPVQQQLRSRTTTFDHLLEIRLPPKGCWGWYDMVTKSLTETHPTQEVVFVTSNLLRPCLYFSSQDHERLSGEHVLRSKVNRFPGLLYLLNTRIRSSISANTSSASPLPGVSPHLRVSIEKPASTPKSVPPVSIASNVPQRHVVLNPASSLLSITRCLISPWAIADPRAR